MLSDNNKMAADKADYTSSRTGAQRSVEPASPELAEEALVHVGLLGSRAVSALSLLLVLLAGADLTTKG